MKVKLLYFARLREVFGCSSEELELPAEVADVAALTEFLRARGAVFQSELAPGRAFRIAVNQEMASSHTPLRDHAEVAIFPPVTGG